MMKTISDVFDVELKDLELAAPGATARSAGAAAANRAQEPRFSSVDDEVNLINDHEDR